MQIFLKFTIEEGLSKVAVTYFVQVQLLEELIKFIHFGSRERTKMTTKGQNNAIFNTLQKSIN